MTEAFPLHWPTGKLRTKYRERSRFKVISFAVVRDNLFAELKRLDAKYVVLSTNIELRQDGIPYANRRQPDDPGVAIYFQYKGKQMAFACDRWDKIEDNIQAIHHTIEALRGIARWGTGDMMQAAFEGFTALSAPKNKEWWDVLEVNRNSNFTIIRENYIRLCRDHHPDNGGSSERMSEINDAYDKAKKQSS